MIYGRILAEDAIDQNGVVVLKAGELITKSALSLLETSNITMVRVRSPLTCHCVSGVCQKCYGMDLATRNLVEVGVPVGVIAAQSIGEPSTQLTLDTFHEGGVAGSSEASGIDRVKQLFEVRAPKNPAIVSPFDGVLSFEETPEGGKFGKIKITSETQKKTYLVKSDYEVVVKQGAELAKGAVYASRGASKLKTKEAGKVLEVNEDYIVLVVQEVYTKSLVGLAPKKTKIGDKVYKGEILTTGALDVMEYKKIVGDIQAQRYIISESKKVYAAQGQDLNDKHIEVVVKQLFSKVFIEDGGDSSFIPGTYVKYEEFIKVNADLQAQGKRAAQGQRVALGLTTVAKETDSWMSAASFQETIRVMVGASLRGAIDHLSDLKANVIIGRLLPV